MNFLLLLSEILAEGAWLRDSAFFAKQLGDISFCLFDNIRIISLCIVFFERSRGAALLLRAECKAGGHQLEKNNVDIHLFKTVTADLVKEENPDAVIVAVGGKRESKLTGTASIPVLSPTEAFGSSRLGETVAILGAGVQAVDFAASLVQQGKKVVMIHSAGAEDIDLGQGGWFRVYMIPYLHANGTRIWSNAEILGLDDDGLRFVADSGLEKTVKVDSVVEFYTALPNTELAEELEAAGFEVHCAGDCVEPFNIQRAVCSGNLAGRAV